MSEGLLDVDAAARFIGVTPKELSKLASDGVIARQSGKYHPVQLVQHYMTHLRSELEKGEFLTQVEIARRLDMTERNLRDVMKNLKIDHRTTHFDDILIAYIRDMREKAAGRGGEDQAAINQAKIRESTANAQLKELQFHQSAGDLVPIEEIEPLLSSWAVTARSETQHALEKIVAGIESKYDINIDQELIDGPFTAALAAIASYPKRLAEDDAEGRGEMGATA